jgi:hypothetical protein
MPFSAQEVAQMSQRADETFMTAEQAPAIEPFASIMEYGDRVGSRHRWMLEQLDRLRERPERWIVAGPARVEEWHVGAIVVGPPGFFLIWPMTTRVEPALWETLRACRDHVQRTLGDHSPAAVEVVVFSPSDERGHMQRWMNTEFDVLTAHGNDLDRLLAEWEPISGVLLGGEWLSRFAMASAPRESLYGPDQGGHQQYPNWSAPRADAC